MRHLFCGNPLRAERVSRRESAAADSPGVLLTLAARPMGVNRVVRRALTASQDF